MVAEACGPVPPRERQQPCPCSFRAVPGDVFRVPELLGPRLRRTFQVGQEELRRLGTGNPGLDGGISGAFPLHGRYGRFEVLNWAVKFFADSLMMEADIATRSADATPPQMAGALR